MTEPSTTDQLRDELAELARRVETVSFRLPGTHRDDRNELGQELAWHLTEYLLPRLADLDAPAVVVLVGSTGAGKSTMLNSVADAPVSRPGAVRPTTRVPVLWTHEDERSRYGREVLPSFTGADRAIEVAKHDREELRGVTVIDTPDLDSVEASHREIAEDVLAVADLCVFVTSAQRYADAVPWQVLRDVRERDLPLLIVLNRLPRDGADEIVADLRRRLEDARVPGAGDVEVVRVPEQQPAGEGGVLSRDDLAPLLSRLRSLADREARSELVRDALAGGLAHTQRLGEVLAEELEAEAAEADALRASAVSAYDAELESLATSLEEGRLIKGEVLARWQEFVGTGELVRALAEGAGRVRGWLRRVLGGQERNDTVEGEARTTLADTVAARADRAAGATAAAWDLSPAGRELLDPSLWRAAPGTDDRARRAVEDWLAELAAMVAREGGDKKRIAQVASAGVNVVAVALMLVVFSQTGGLSGAEVGITAGAAAVQQRLLEHVFGTAAARALVEEGRRKLLQAMEEVLADDRRRFEDRLVPVAPPEGVAGHLREQLERVATAARTAGFGVIHG